jgi:hypothetical protein
MGWRYFFVRLMNDLRYMGNSYIENKWKYICWWYIKIIIEIRYKNNNGGIRWV